MDQKLNRNSKIRVSYEVSTDAKIIGREEERRGGKIWGQNLTVATFLEAQFVTVR